MQKLKFLLILILVVSCKTVQVNHQQQRTTKGVVELGAIGTITKGLKHDVFQTNTLPYYKEKLRVLVNMTTFTDDTFTVYTQAAQQQNKPIIFTYIDTVENKPGYAQLQLIDKVKLIEQLNAEHNKSTNTFLQNSNDNSLVTRLAVYFNASDLNNLSIAEEVYLVNKKPQKYSLELVANGKAFAMLDVNKAVPFAYTTGNFCWKKEQGQITIANIIEDRETCARDTYEDVARLNKKVNYFKY